MEVLPFTVSLDRIEEAEDHVRFGFLVRHCSGASWRTSRRFSEFTRLHDDLGADIKDGFLLPSLQWSWLPSFAQAFDSGFCGQRQQELQQYLDAVLRVPHLVEHPAVHAFLAVKCPEPPIGVRIVQRQSGFKLELRFSSEAEAGPVDAYRMRIVHTETGVSFQVARRTWPVFEKLHSVHIGHLDPGEHCCSVVALNCIGESAPVDISVQVPLSPLRPASDVQLTPACTDLDKVAGEVALACDDRHLGASKSQTGVYLPPYDDTDCVICLAAVKTHAFVPCGHQCVCARCAESVTRRSSAVCPLCRVPTERALQIFA